eukprot:298414-Ditylum_brightwellii.AAC.1
MTITFLLMINTGLIWMAYKGHKFGSKCHHEGTCGGWTSNFGHNFLREEDVLPGKEASVAAFKTRLESSSDYLWIADPVDGTSNLVSYSIHTEVKYLQHKRDK